MRTHLCFIRNFFITFWTIYQCHIITILLNELYFSTRYKSSIYPQYVTNSTIFKTIGEGDSTKVVTVLQARKIAEEELNATITKQAAILETDKIALELLETKVAQGIPYEQAFAQSMNNASVSAKEHAVATKGAAGSTDTFVAKQKAAQAELKATATAAKGASVAMKALSVVGNMFVMFAITTAISLVIKGIDNLVHASEKAIERMDEAKSKISELNTEHENHAKLVKESGDRYVELSNKMDSLTTDELEEFNELNKQFIEAFPELITGFDNQGNAIANIGSNADESRKKLQELLEQEEKTANYEIFKNLNELYVGTKVKLDEAIKSQKEYDNSISKANEKLKNTEGFTEFDDSISITLDYKNNGAQIRNNLMDLLDEFKRTLHEDYDDYSLDQELINAATAIDNGTFDEYTGEQNVWFSLINWTPEQKSLFKQMLQDDSIEVTSAIKNELANVSGALKDEIGNLTQENEKAQQEAESAWRDYTNNLANAMQSQQTFKDIGDEGLQDIAIAMVRGLDRSLYEEGQNINYDWIRNNILNGLKNLDDDAKFEVKMAYQQLLTLDPNDITPENQLAIENIINDLSRLLDKDPIQIRLAFGFDENGLQTQYAQTMRKAYAKFGGDQYDDRGFVTGDTVLDNFAKENSINTEEERAFWDKCIEESETREEAMQKYLNQNPNKTDIQFSDIFALKNSDDSLTELGKINEEIEKFQSAYKGLKSAMDSYNETGYFTLDQVQEIISHGDEYLKYLVDENGQLQLNEEALNNVAIARINEMRAKVLSDLMNNLEGITNEESALNYLSTQLYETADSYDDFTASRIQAWSVKALDEYGMDQTVVDGVVKSFTNIVSAANEMFDNLNIDSFGKSLDKAGSKAEADWKKLLDAELNLLDKQLEAGLISFNDYINKRKGLIEDYYNDGKIAADEYYTYLEEHYKKELSYMDKVINAVTRKIDKEIKGLKEQQDAIKERYQLEIDKLNEQKKLIEEANAERQRQIDLQKALYELERAQNQRTTLMYSEEKGMHYVANSGAIRDAQNNLEDKEYEIKISEIEKSIEKLEEARDRELEAIDEMIERLEEYKEYWNEISSEYENQQEELLAAQILGQDWEKQILDQRLDTLKKFKDRYIEIQQAIVDAAYEAAKARGEEAERTIIGDSSARKPGDDPKIKGWEVVNEDGGESEGVYNTEEEAKAEAQLLNKRKAKSYGMSLEEFLDSNIPKYYVLKKYHTGLKQGLVDSHTFDDDFKLVQKVGLGQDEVLAILQKNEAVITPDQISNLANGLRNYTLPEYITPLSLDDSFLNTLIFDNNIAKKMNESMSKLANSISNKTTGVNEIKQEFYITLPNVTDNTAAITLMRDLESLATKKLHEF